MIRNNIDLVMTYHVGKSVALSLLLSGPLSRSLAFSLLLSHSHSCSLALLLALAILLSRSRSYALVLTLALSLALALALFLSQSYFTRDHFRDKETAFSMKQWKKNID